MDTPRTLGSQNKPLGDRGERLAADFLERGGWTILARNFRIGHREVDLEVVTARVLHQVGRPLELVSGRTLVIGARCDREQRERQDGEALHGDRFSKNIATSKWSITHAVRVR